MTSLAGCLRSFFLHTVIFIKCLLDYGWSNKVFVKPNKIAIY